jgi:hypothetical protein
MPDSLEKQEKLDQVFESLYPILLQVMPRQISASRDLNRHDDQMVLWFVSLASGGLVTIGPTASALFPHAGPVWTMGAVLLFLASITTGVAYRLTSQLLTSGDRRQAESDLGKMALLAARSEMEPIERLRRSVEYFGGKHVTIDPSDGGMVFGEPTPEVARLSRLAWRCNALRIYCVVTFLGGMTIVPLVGALRRLLG